MPPTASSVCLIGESDTFLARLLTRFCEGCGLSAVRAQVGEEVVALAAECHPDLIILDVELPGERRGWQAAEALKLENGFANVPVISCSWLTRTDAAALAPDCAAYLQKPDLHFDDFVAALKDAGFDPARA